VLIVHRAPEPVELPLEVLGELEALEVLDPVDAGDEEELAGVEVLGAGAGAGGELLQAANAAATPTAASPRHPSRRERAERVASVPETASVVTPQR
jgi:hypothetical protein